MGLRGPQAAGDRLGVALFMSFSSNCVPGTVLWPRPETHFHVGHKVYRQEPHCSWHLGEAKARRPPPPTCLQGAAG